MEEQLLQRFGVVSISKVLLHFFLSDSYTQALIAESDCFASAESDCSKSAESDCPENAEFD